MNQRSYPFDRPLWGLWPAGCPCPGVENSDPWDRAVALVELGFPNCRDGKSWKKTIIQLYRHPIIMDPAMSWRLEDYFASFFLDLLGGWSCPKFLPWSKRWDQSGPSQTWLSKFKPATSWLSGWFVCKNHGRYIQTSWLSKYHGWYVCKNHWKTQRIDDPPPGGCQGWARLRLPELPHHGYTNGPASAHLGTGYTPKLPTFCGGKKLGH